MRVYLFGPMVKYRDSGWNRERFTIARDEPMARGHEVCSPMVVDDGVGGPDAAGRHFPLSFLLAFDIQVLGTCDAIVAIEENFGDSRGSRVEAFAALTFGLPVLRFPPAGPGRAKAALAPHGDEVR